MPHIQYPKRKFDPRPGRASQTGPNSVGKVPITRMAPVNLKKDHCGIMSTDPSDVEAFIAALDNLYLGIGSYAVPDWPEGDSRWKVGEIVGRRNHRLQALDYIVEPVRVEVEQRYRDELQAMVDGGVPRPVIARGLGISLAELRDQMGWP